MNPRGSLLSVDAQRALSASLYPLGDQCPQIWDELDLSGYGAPIRIYRESVRQLARNEENYQQVVHYWIEYAKERLAGLVGPMDMLAGRIPEIAAYRSTLLKKLRGDVKAGLLKSEGTFTTPQIQPTLKRHLEMFADYRIVKAEHERTKSSVGETVKALGLIERPDFPLLGTKERYELLTRRYKQNLEPAGFTLDSHRKRGVVFRKIVANGRWAFVLVDDSKDRMDGGMLSIGMAVTLPKNAILPGAVPLTSAATFAPVDLVPGFRAVCGFDGDSYAQLCLACDATSALAKSIAKRLDKLL